MSVADRLKKLNARIESACRRAGRDPLTVRLLAVSKLQPLSKIRQAYEAGQTHFAENYVQEALNKQEQLANLPVDWHFIGRIQSNKAKMLPGKFKLIHSVDRLSVVDALAKTGVEQEILLQFNVAGEQQKGGATEEELEVMLKHADASKLKVRGLMVMPPFTENPEEVRPFFRRAREKAQALGLSELSMGTTQDFEVAIEEGATWIRVGTDVFGPREKEEV
jgi:PLP dependent protein